MHRLIVGEGLTYFSQGFHLCLLCWWPLSADGQRVDAPPEAVDAAIAALVCSERGSADLAIAPFIDAAIRATFELLDSLRSYAADTTESTHGRHAAGLSGAVDTVNERLGVPKHHPGGIPVSPLFASMQEKQSLQPMQYAIEPESAQQPHADANSDVVEAAMDVLPRMVVRLFAALIDLLVILRPAEAGASERNAGGSSIG